MREPQEPGCHLAQAWEIPTPPGHRAGNGCVRRSPTSSRLASCANKSPSMRLDTANRKETMLAGGAEHAAEAEGGEVDEAAELAAAIAMSMDGQRPPMPPPPLPPPS